MKSHRERDVTRLQIISITICERVVLQLLSNLSSTIISLGWFNDIMYYAHHWFCSPYLNDPQNEKHDMKENLGVFISNVLFLPTFRAVAFRKTSRMETLAVTLALTENSNVSQTLGVHLRRKRVAAPYRNVLNGGRESKSKPRCLFETLYAMLRRSERRDVKEDFTWLAGNSRFWEICYSRKTI